MSTAGEVWPICRYVLGVSVLTALVACGGRPIRYAGQSSPAPVPADSGGLRAGFERIDITPPPGPGLMGYGIEGDTARGYRNRLYARAMVLEDRTGERIAIVTLDLLAPSLALHRSVARLILESTRIGPDRLLLAATHTHAGPANYFAVRGLDGVGSSVEGFDPEMLRFLSVRIARAVQSAASRLEIAKASWSVAPVWGATRIRNFEPFEKNDPPWRSRFEPDPTLPARQRAVDPSWAMLRVDVLDRSTGDFRPLGAFSVFAIHGTGIPSGNDLFDSDLHGVVARRMEQRMASLRGDDVGPHPPTVHLFANGAEGDVSPLWTPDTRCQLPTLKRLRRPSGPRTPPSPEAWVPIPDSARSACMGSALTFVDAVAEQLADHAFRQYKAAKAHLTRDIYISRAFQVLPLSGSSADPRLCEHPRVGVATPGGAPDGYTRIHGWRLFGFVPVGLEEGASSRGDSSNAHCHAPKKRLLNPIWPILTGDNMLPRVAQLSVVRIGGMLIGTVPGEPTTTVGGRIRAAMGAAAEDAGIQTDSVLLLGLTNGYIDYVATPEEYDLQFYEGSSTLFGPYTATVLQDALARLAATIPDPGTPSPPASVPDAVVFPSPSRSILPPLGLRSESVRRQIDVGWRGDILVARWNDHRPGSLNPSDGPVLVVERLVNGRWDATTWDDDHELEVRWMEGHSWEARWTPCIRVAGAYRVVLLERHAQPAVQSASARADARNCRLNRSPELPRASD